MSITVQDLITTTNNFFSDTSNDSVSASEIYAALSEACTWLIDTTTNDHTLKSARFQYIPGIKSYKTSLFAPALFTPADLRREDDKHTIPATYKSSREIAEDTVNGMDEFAYSIDRYDGQSYLTINLPSYEEEKFSLNLQASAGTVALTPTGDGTSEYYDLSDTTYGYGLFQIGFDVSASASDYAGLKVSWVNSFDVRDYEDVGVFISGAYFPTLDTIESVTFRFGEDDSNYWTTTVTTQADGKPFAVGDNTFAFSWADVTTVGTPDSSLLKFYEFRINYDALQPDASGFKFGVYGLSMPEWMTLYYSSDAIGTTNAGVPIFAFTAATDIPYFSGQHDNYKYAVGHKAAELLFRNIRMYNEADRELVEATKALNQKMKIIPSSTVKEERTFKPRGLNFTRRKY